MDKEHDQPTDERIYMQSIRLPDSLHRRLKNLARQHKRSLHGEMLWALQEYARQQHSAEQGSGE